MGKLTPAQKQWISDFGVSLGLDSERNDGTESMAEGFDVTRVSGSKEMSSGKSRPLSATFEVQWVEDSDQFYQRVLKAIRANSAFKGISAEQLNAVSSAEPQTLMALVATFHQKYAMRHSNRRAGQKLTVRFSAYYSADPQIWNSSVTGKTLSLVEDAVTAKPEKERSGAAPPSGPAAMLARQAVEADLKGWAGMKFSVKNDGRSTVVMSFEKVGPQSARPAGARELSQAAALKELESFMANAAEHKGVWEGQFGRDPKTGAMVFMKWAKSPDSPAPPPPPPPAPARRPLSKAEQFERETGVVYPPRINKTLKDVGAQALKDANPLSLQNLPYTIAGMVIPIAAMKLLTMDTASLSGIIRLEWQVDRTIVQEANLARQTQGTPKAPMPTRNLQPGDIIKTATHGEQRVVSVSGNKFVTEPFGPKHAIKPIEGHSGKDVLNKYQAKEHVFKGDSSGGYHSKARPNPGGPNPSVRQLEVVKNPKNGVYEIKFERIGPDGKKVPFKTHDGKVSDTKKSTMFPDGMTERQVLDEVYGVMLKHKTTPLPPPDANGIIKIVGQGKGPKGNFDIVVMLKSDGKSNVLLTFHPLRPKGSPPK